MFHVDSSLEEMGRTVALFVVLSFVTVSNTMKIAICVTGQKGRLHLDHLQESVLEVNARSASPLELNLFIFLQTGVTIFNTMNNTKSESRFDTMSDMEVEKEINRTWGKVPYVEVTEVKFHHFIEMHEFTKMMNQEQSLDIFNHFNGSTTVNILNMYKHHERCADSVLEKEASSSNIKYEYVVNTREDIYFFGLPVSLNDLTETARRHRCDFVSKGCLEWHGLNMRFHLMRAKVGLAYMKSSLHLYKQAIEKKNEFWNPEMFELYKAQKMRLNLCRTSANVLPVTAIRYGSSHNISSKIPVNPICLSPIEISRHCVPDSFASYEHWNQSLCKDWFNGGHDIFTENPGDYKEKNVMHQRTDMYAHPNPKVVRRQHNFHIYRNGILSLPSHCIPNLGPLDQRSKWLHKKCMKYYHDYMKLRRTNS